MLNKINYSCLSNKHMFTFNKCSANTIGKVRAD